MFGDLRGGAPSLRIDKRVLSQPWNPETPCSEIRVEKRADKAVFSCDTFAWAVCIDPECDSDVPDDLFDLLPGIEYAIDWPPDRPLPEVRRRKVTTP